MIALDTSAVMAIIANETMADSCSDILQNNTSVVMSAGTLTELLIVATRREALTAVRDLISISVTSIIEVTPERAQMAAAAYAQWGKGFHKASLNFGDCFAYATAKEFDCPLLYVGNDFAQTDVKSAIAATSP